MAIENDEDRLAFFDTDDFAFTAVITITGGGTLTVVGNYDSTALTRGLKQNNQFSFQQGQDLSGNKPCFRARTSDFPGVRNGHATLAITDNSTSPPTLIGNFTAFNVSHDGTGMSEIRLMAV